MDGFEDSVMIALLPTESSWCKLALPHLTLVYAGKVLDIDTPTYNDMLKAAISLSMSYGPVTLSVTGVERFGDPEVDPVDVLIFEHTPKIQSMRNFVAQWSVSEHPFTPHATIGPPGAIVGVTIPTEVVFDHVQVSFGEEYTHYKLLGG